MTILRQYFYLGIFGIVAGLLLICYSQAQAHEFWINHSGYKSLSGNQEHCCGKNDCFEYQADDVAGTAAGWLIKSLGELVPYSDTQASEDGKFWRCKRYDGSRRCFFAPAPAS